MVGRILAHVRRGWRGGEKGKVWLGYAVSTICDPLGISGGGEAPRLGGGSLAGTVEWN